MTNSQDSDYSLDLGRPEQFSAIQGAKEGDLISVLVCFTAHSLRVGRETFKAVGMLKNGVFFVAFHDDFGFEKFDLNYAALIQEIESCA